ncbi:hypothetical protein GM31_09345 [Trabulsiella odontotermitis]|uniref:Uncharacterized protein n=1 Tax=Trabulsiella odontotermitis TaxID=379893 RepID=A0A0L0H1I0_9ENTR|nr:hypothetical protein GM31_09345 [Trabulsiella odontotermitis]
MLTVLIAPEALFYFIYWCHMDQRHIIEQSSKSPDIVIKKLTTHALVQSMPCPVLLIPDAA